MGWLRLVGSLNWYVSFAEYSLFYRALLQKRPIILRSLLIVATHSHFLWLNSKDDFWEILSVKTRVIANKGEILKSHLAAEFSALHDCQADFWEIQPVKMRVVADERDVLKSQLAAKLSAWYDCRADFWEILPVKRRLTCDETNSQKSARCWIYHFNDSRVDLRESVRFQTRLIADERNSERQLAAEFATSMIMELNPKKVYLSRRDRSLMGEILNSQLAVKLCA